jgi:hypothetical protein
MLRSMQELKNYTIGATDGGCPVLTRTVKNSTRDMAKAKIADSVLQTFPTKWLIIRHKESLWHRHANVLSNPM